MTTKYIDLTPFASDAEPTEKEWEEYEAAVAKGDLFLKKIDDFVKTDYKKFALVQMFPGVHPFKKEDVFFWERILAHKTLWEYLSAKIAAQWKLEPSQLSWDGSETLVETMRPVDIATSEVFQKIDYSVTNARENYNSDEIVYLVLDGNQLYDMEFPNQAITLSERKARLVSQLKNTKTATEVLTDYSGFIRDKGTRQAILELNHLVRGKLRIGRAMTINDGEGDGYRLVKSIRLRVI